MATVTRRIVIAPQRAFRLQVIVQRALVFLCLAALALIFLAPIWFMVVTSFKPNELAVRDMGSAMAFVPRFHSIEVPAPEGWSVFENYRALFDRLFVGRTFLNSLIICGGVVIGRL